MPNLAAQTAPPRRSQWRRELPGAAVVTNIANRVTNDFRSADSPVFWRRYRSLGSGLNSGPKPSPIRQLERSLVRARQVPQYQLISGTPDDPNRIKVIFVRSQTCGRPKACLTSSAGRDPCPTTEDTLGADTRRSRRLGPWKKSGGPIKPLSAAADTCPGTSFLHPDRQKKSRE